MPKMLNNLDLNTNQILNVVAQNLGTDPGTPFAGQWWYNTVSNKMKYNNGSGIVTFYDTSDATNANTASKLVLRDGSGNFAANVGTFNSITINNAPVNNTDAATIGYVQTQIQGLNPKPSATVATTGGLPSYTYSNGASGVGATITFTGTGAVTIDGHVLALNDIVLVMNETGANAPYNGLYVVTTAPATGVAGVLTRSVDLNSSAQFAGAYVLIMQGTINADSGWLYSGTATPTVGTSNITFGQFTGAGEVSVSTPLTKSGSVISLSLNARLVNNAGNLDLQSGVVTANTYYGSITVDTYGRVTAGADIISSNGLVTRTAADTFTGVTVTGTTNQITVANGNGVGGNPTISISATYIGQTSITTLGTIITGVWQGTTISIGYGGTGAATAAAAFNNLSPMTTLGDVIYGGASGVGTRLAGNTSATRKFLSQTGNGSVSAAPTWTGLALTDLPAGTIQKYSANIGDNSTTSIVVTHNLNTKAILVTLVNNSSPYDFQYPDIQATTVNTCTLVFAVAPTTNQFTVVVAG